MPKQRKNARSQDQEQPQRWWHSVGQFTAKAILPAWHLLVACWQHTVMSLFDKGYSAIELLKPLGLGLLRCGEVLTVVLYFLLVPLSYVTSYVGAFLRECLLLFAQSYQAFENWQDRRRKETAAAEKAALALAVAEDREQFQQLRAVQADGGAKSSKKQGAKRQPAAAANLTQRKPQQQLHPAGAADDTKRLAAFAPTSNAGKAPAPAAREEGGKHEAAKAPNPSTAPRGRSRSSTRSAGSSVDGTGKRGSEVLPLAVAAEVEEEEEGSAGAAAEEGGSKDSSSEGAATSEAATEGSPRAASSEQQWQHGASRGRRKGGRAQAAPEAVNQAQGQQLAVQQGIRAGAKGSTGEGAAKQVQHKQRTVARAEEHLEQVSNEEQPDTQAGSEDAPAAVAAAAAAARQQQGWRKQQGPHALAEAGLESPAGSIRHVEAAVKQGRKKQGAREAGDSKGSTAGVQQKHAPGRHAGPEQQPGRRKLHEQAGQQGDGNRRGPGQEGQPQQLKGQQRGSVQPLLVPPAAGFGPAAGANGTDVPSHTGWGMPEEGHGGISALQRPPSPHLQYEQLQQHDWAGAPLPATGPGTAAGPPLPAYPDRQKGHYRPVMGQQHLGPPAVQQQQQPNGFSLHPAPPAAGLPTFPQPGWQPPQHSSPPDRPGFAQPGLLQPGGMLPPRPTMNGAGGPAGYPPAAAGSAVAQEVSVDFQGAPGSDHSGGGEADDSLLGVRPAEQPLLPPLPAQWSPERTPQAQAGWEQQGHEQQSQQEGQGQPHADPAEPLISGLSNEAGEYNCFLNAIVQCLWRCNDFRKQVLSWPPFLAEYNAVLRAVHDLFTQLDKQQQQALQAQSNGHGAQHGQHGWRSGQNVVNPNQLREALSKLPGQFFREGEMNDAGEVLQAIYNQILVGVTAGKKMGLDLGVDLEGVLGLSVHECVRCEDCGGLTTHRNSYTQFFYTAQATGLRDMLRAQGGHSKGLGPLLHEVEQQTLKSCDTDHGGCNARLPVVHTLERPPRVFTLQLSWGSHGEEGFNIQATLAAVSEEIDLSTVYHGLEPGQHVYRLRSMVCYYGAHYFAYVLLPEQQAWARIDDAKVSKEASWEDVKKKCVAGRAQPNLLFFEKVDQ